MSHSIHQGRAGETEGERQRVSAFAIETNGVGQRSDYHLNLTRCIPMPVKRVGNPAGFHGIRPPKRPRAAPEPDQRSAFAGRERQPLPATRFMRLKTDDGRWLHMSGEGLTVVKADSWVGTAPQLFKLREAHPDLNSMTVSAP